MLYAKFGNNAAYYETFLQNTAESINFNFLLATLHKKESSI